jgi:hypothetical protein
VVGAINASVGWLPFALAKMRITSQNQNPLFFFSLTFALEIRIYKCILGRMHFAFPKISTKLLRFFAECILWIEIREITFK